MTASISGYNKESLLWLRVKQGSTPVHYLQRTEEEDSRGKNANTQHLQNRRERERSKHRRCESYLFFFFPLLPSNLFTFLSSTYFSNLKFCVFLSLVLLNLSSSIFLNSQANYNRSEGKTLFHSFILYSLSHFGSFYSCLTRSSLKNISGQPETALHEEIF